MSARELDAFARSQYGLITKTQFLSVKSSNSLDWMLRSGELVTAHEGVYLLPGAPLSQRAQIMAAVLASPEGTAASHESAGLLHGLDINSLLPHVIVPGNRSRQRPGIISHFGNLDYRELTRRFGIPVAAIERTFVDLAGSICPTHLARLMDDAVIAGKTTFEKIHEALLFAGTNGRKGSAMLRKILEDRIDLGADGMDSKMRPIILKAAKLAGLPEPVCEYEVWANGRHYFIDVAWPDLIVGAEGDGYSVHGRSKLRFDKDRERHNDISGEGWTLLHFTMRMSITDIAAQLAKVCTKSRG